MHPATCGLEFHMPGTALGALRAWHVQHSFAELGASASHMQPGYTRSSGARHTCAATMHS